MESEIKNIHKDLIKLRVDIKLIKNILLSEGELTDWAKNELAEARKVPNFECVSHEDVEKRILEDGLSN